MFKPLQAAQSQYPHQERALTKETAKVHFRFHFTPTRSSWLNQVEIWFSILQRQSLNGALFAVLEQRQQHINAIMAEYNHAIRLVQPAVIPGTRSRQEPGFVIGNEAIEEASRSGLSDKIADERRRIWAPGRLH